MKKKIYIAAPLFNDHERAFNRLIKNHLSNNFTVYLPQEDGKLLIDLLNAGMSINDAESHIFFVDVEAMKSSDILIAILDGAHIDEGVAFELGYMNACNKLCIALQTDIRRQLQSGNNPMINQSVNKIFHNLDDMLTWINQLA